MPSTSPAGREPEEGKRDVEVLRRHEAGVADGCELPRLPGGEPLDGVGRQRQGGEEAQSLMPLDATGRGHACVCRAVTEAA